MNVFDGLVYACVHVCMHMLLSMCTYWNARGDEKGNEGWAEAQGGGGQEEQGKRRTMRRMHRVGGRWGERSQAGLFAASTGHCLLLKAQLGYCFYTRRGRDHF